MPRHTFCALVLFLPSLTFTLCAQDSPKPAAPSSGTGTAVADDPLTRRVDDVIASTSRRVLSAEVHTPWQIMHGVLALRGDFRIKRDGKLVNALEWISSGPSFKREAWFERTTHGGRAHPFKGPYDFEGHPNQFLAILTMSDVPPEHKLQAAGGEITIAGMIRHAQMEVSDKQEPAWTLWALSKYLPPDAEWRNKRGEGWSMERLVRQQLREPTQRAACGGTHGLFALSTALDRYRKAGHGLSGAWIEADQHVRRYLETARSLQNADGTFSTSYFQGRASSREFATRLQTSGHTLEFVVAGLPKERLKEPWVRRAVTAMVDELVAHRKDPADCGALYHALDALVIYRERTRPSSPPPLVAETSQPAAGDGADDAAPAGDAEQTGP
ncbi:MAG: hypothetical protein KY476_13450 [Planctomycetes bacterium]|nr:hypothetical protein [Planctomycetota bacterium]